MTFVFTEKHVLTHNVSYSSKICVSTFSKTNVSDSGPWMIRLHLPWLVSTKKLKVLPPPSIHLRRSYKFENDTAPQLLLLPWRITELSGMRSYEIILRMDVTFTFSEMEEVEASVRILLEAASWVDWWLFSA